MDSHDEFCEKVVVDVGPGNIESGCGCKERWSKADIARLRGELVQMQKMQDENKTGQATIPADLEERIMNPCIAKNEQEWWAQREITRLRGENDRLKSFGVAHELEDARERIAAVEAENGRLKERLKIVGQTAEANIEFARDQQIKIAALEAENERLKNSLAVQANQIIDAAFKIAALDAELTQANHWLQSREAELKTAQDTLVDVYGRCAALEDENERLKKEVYQRWTELNSLRPERDDEPDDQIASCLRCGLSWEGEKNQDGQHICPPGFWNEYEKRITALEAELVAANAAIEW